MASIFVSHSSVEANLAKYFASWIDTAFPGVKCYCSSRPIDLPPGTNWPNDIIDKASSSDLCLLLLSPNSANNSWIYFEAGLILGAKRSNQIVPTIYGGMNIPKIPSPVRNLQALVLDDPDSFNAFVEKGLLAGKSLGSNQDYKSFVGGMDGATQRLLKYGEFALLTSQVIQTELLKPPSLTKTPNNAISLKRHTAQGSLIAIRAKIVPRRVSPLQHWKFGITLRNSFIPRVFQFHSGCHQGFNTWVIYDSPSPPLLVSMPARLEMDRPSSLELWLTSDVLFVVCVGIDCDGSRTVMTNDRGENRWRLINDVWDTVEISGWADGENFQIDIEKVEIDRAI